MVHSLYCRTDPGHDRQSNFVHDVELKAQRKKKKRTSPSYHHIKGSSKFLNSCRVLGEWWLGGHISQLYQGCKISWTYFVCHHFRQVQMTPFTPLVHWYVSKHIGPIFIQNGGRVGVVMIVHLEWPSGNWAISQMQNGCLLTVERMSYMKTYFGYRPCSEIYR